MSNTVQKFRKIHSVVWKFRKFSLTLFWQKFRENNVFIEQNTKELIWWIFFPVRLNFSHFHSTVWKNEKFGLTEKIFRQINSLVICLVKPLLSRNFCRKSVRLKFHNFHTVSRITLRKLLKFTHNCFFGKISWIYQINDF